MKKIISIIFLCLVSSIFAEENDNTINLLKETKENKQEKDLDTNSLEVKLLDKKTSEHFENLMKIMEGYNYKIKTKKDYEFFLEIYKNGSLNIDEKAMYLIKFEIERYNWKEKE